MHSTIAMVYGKQIIKNRLEKKYKRLLDMPPWTTEELSGLDHSLRPYVKKGIRELRELKYRLEDLSKGRAKKYA